MAEQQSATPMPGQQWVYRASVTNVVDGDTLDVVIDAGFRATRTERLRLLGVNTPERKGPTRLDGDAARDYVTLWVELASDPGEPWPLLVQTEQSDAFGRYLGTVWSRADGRCLNDDLLSTGHAVPFKG